MCEWVFAAGTQTEGVEWRTAEMFTCLFLQVKSLPVSHWTCCVLMALEEHLDFQFGNTIPALCTSYAASAVQVIENQDILQQPCTQ